MHLSNFRICGTWSIGNDCRTHISSKGSENRFLGKRGQENRFCELKLYNIVTFKYSKALCKDSIVNMIQFVSSNGMYILYKYYTHNYHYTYLPYYTITHTIPLSILYCYLYYTTIHMILLTMPYHYPYYTTIHTIQLYILYY